MINGFESISKTSQQPTISIKPITINASVQATAGNISEGNFQKNKAIEFIKQLIQKLIFLNENGKICHDEIVFVLGNGMKIIECLNNEFFF